MKKLITSFSCVCKKKIKPSYCEKNFSDNPDYKEIIESTKPCFVCKKPARISNCICSCVICKNCIEKYIWLYNY